MLLEYEIWIEMEKFSKSKTTFMGKYDYDFLAKTEDCAKLRQMQLFILIELKHLCYKPLLFLNIIV